MSGALLQVSASVNRLFCMPVEAAARSQPRASCRADRRLTIALVASESEARIGSLLSLQGGELISFGEPRELLDVPVSSISLVVYCFSGEPAQLQSIEELREHLDGSPILLVCEEVPRWRLRKLLAAGVGGLVLRDEAERTIGPCLQAVLSGQTCLPSCYRDQIEPPVLSTREKQVLSLVVLGYMNSQIAQQLFLAESTIKSHLSSAFSKLGVRSRNEAVELILNPEGGLGMGILALGGEPVRPSVD